MAEAPSEGPADATSQLEAEGTLRLRIGELEESVLRARRRLRPYWTLGMYGLAGGLAGLVAGRLLGSMEPILAGDALSSRDVLDLSVLVGVAIGSLIETRLYLRARDQAHELTRLRQQLVLNEHRH